MDFIQEVFSGNLSFLDGGMGTMLMRGEPFAGAPELLNLTQPQRLIDIHRAYLAAGASAIYANTFGANRYKLEGSGYTVAEVVAAGIANARKAADEFGAFVGLDIGSCGQLLAPAGPLSFDDAYEVFAEIVQASAGADFVVIETMSDLAEMRAAVLAARENTDLPVICSMTFTEGMKTFYGCDVRAMALSLEALGVDAVGINCSLGPEKILPIAAELAQHTRLPVFAKPNAGMPDAEGHHHLSPADFAALCAGYAEAGVAVLGGCCGTEPETIRLLKEKYAHLTPAARKYVGEGLCCNTASLVEFGGLQPETAPAPYDADAREALADEDVYGLLDCAIDLGEDAEMLLLCLDGSVSPALIDSLIPTLQSTALCPPLALACGDAAMVERFLRIYAGRAALFLSDDPSLHAIAARYGALVRHAAEIECPPLGLLLLN